MNEAMQITIEKFLQHSVAIKSRLYSVAQFNCSDFSTPKVNRTTHFDRFSIIVSKTTLPNEKLGLCTHQLWNMKRGDTLEFDVRPSMSFRLDYNPDQDIFMIANGSGIAPFFSFLQKIYSEKPASATNKVIFVYGCRRKADFELFGLLEKYKQLGVLTIVEVAYSQEPTQPKTYVQDLIKPKAVDWFGSPSTKVYVCGSKEMGREVCSIIEPFRVSVFKDLY